MYIASSVNLTNCTTGETRLSGTLQGCVELCYNNVWYGVCGDNYNQISSVICKNAGHQKGCKLLTLLFIYIMYRK